MSHPEITSIHNQKAQIIEIEKLDIPKNIKITKEVIFKFKNNELKTY